MRIAPAKHRAYTYKITLPPSESAVSLDTLKAHLKITTNDEDVILQMYLDASIRHAENCTKRTFLYTGFDTFRDFFPSPCQNEGYYTAGVIPSLAAGINFSNDNVGFEIRRSPLVTIDNITYTDTSDATVAVPGTVYYNTLEEDYSEIVTNPGQDWPTDVAKKMQAITISFTAGLAPDSATFEAQQPDLVNAVIQIAANLWANRGDCGDDACGNATPAGARSALMKRRIESL